MSNKFMTFEQYLQGKGVSLLTLRGYLADVRLFTEWFGKRRAQAFAIENLSANDMCEYRQYLQNEMGFKASTISRKLASLSAFSRWAVQTNQLGLDPAERMKFPRWLDRQEQSALITAIERDIPQASSRWYVTRRRDTSIILFMLHSGLRLSEALSLELEDARIESILVRRANGNRERRMPLGAEARKVLQDWLAVRPPDRIPFVWVAMDGIVKERAVQQVLNRYARAAGLMEFSADVLRHTFARNMVNAGAGLEEIAALLGTANLKSMQSYVAADPRGQENSECQ